MEEPDTIVDSPYRFLDYYKPEDRDIFFGRESEKRILVADICVQRLVVLFAKTGTGKTSLINAGVRPILEEQDFDTFFIRVKKDPVESARREIIRSRKGLTSGGQLRWKNISDDGKLIWQGESFAEKLENIAAQLGKKIVLFFDQFEEFFIYPIEEAPVRNPEEQRLREQEIEEQRAKRLQFVKDLAALYHNPKSRVHVVLSMREEWFIELDIFRDEIPKIYHNDSNLRLRWFDVAQARDAIQLPVKEYNVTIKDEAVDRLISDLAIDGMIEPAQLQIVCDTLWRETRGDFITLDDYLRLGNEASRNGQTIAKKILYRRLEKEFEQIESDEDLYLFYAVLPKLRTPKKTKYVREIDALVEELIADDPSLPEIINDETIRHKFIERLRTNGREMLLDLSELLETRLGLVRKSIRDNLTVIELSHDYLVESLGDLQRSVRAIGPRRLLENIMRDYQGRPDAVPLEQFERITLNLDVLSVSSEQANMMLRCATSSGLYMRRWFDLADEAERWSILGERINNIQETSHVIDLLGDLQTDTAFKLLEETLDHEEIASYAVEVFSLKETLPVVHFLAKALRHDDLIPQARKALARFERSRKNPEVAERARAALESFENEQKSRVTQRGDPRGFLEHQVVDRTFEPFQTTVSTAALEPHYRILLRALADGRVIPFLGPEMNVMDRPAPGHWEHGLLPSSSELATLLAERFGYAEERIDPEYDLKRVSQYIAALHGTGPLYDELHSIYKGNYEPNPLHRLLALLPQNSAFKPPLILTTNYDDVLEQTFKDLAVPFDLVSYVAEAEGETAGRFLHSPHNEEPRYINNPNDYAAFFPDPRTVILKLSGGINRVQQQLDSFVITEDDHIEQLITDISSLMPVALAARLRRSYFLFLGQSLRAWNMRVMLRRIWGEEKPSLQSWSIQFNPDPFEQELWQSRGIKILNVPMKEYVETLQEHVQSFS